MKIFRFLGFALVAILLCLSACSKGDDDPISPTPKPEVNNPTITLDSSIQASGLSFDTSDSEKSISFTTTSDWTLSIAETRSGTEWCTASPTSGGKGTANVKITTTENTEPDDRSVAVTIKAGATSKTFTVTQKGKDALLVTTKKYELPKEGGEIEIEVKANVDYQMTIAESAKEWITEATGRALTTHKHILKIAPSEEAVKREGEITFKSGDMVETVKVYQAGEAVLLLSKNEFTVSDAGETISVDLQSNVEYGVQMPNVDWISDETSSRGMSSHTLYYTILPNETYDSREAEIIFYDKNSPIKDTLRIVQAQKDAIILSKKNYEVEFEGDIIEVELNTNVDFDISIDSTWVKQAEQEKSRGLVSHKLYFQVEKNQTYDTRYAHIAISDKNKSLTDTITICQAQTDTIIIDKGKFTVSAFAEKIEISIKSNIDYKIFIGDDCLSWVEEDSQTRGLIANNRSYLIKKNMSFSSEPRIGHIILESKLGRDSISVIQEAPIYVENAGDLINVIDKDSIGNYEKILITGYLNGNDIIAINRMSNLKVLDIEATNIVEGGSPYIGEEYTKNDHIGYCMFQECKFEKIVLPNSVVAIDAAAFAWSNSLKHVVFGSNIKYVDENAFYYCKKLSDVEFNDGLQIIGDSAFPGCESLNEIKIPNTVTNIGRGVFSGCKVLKNIELSSNLETIGYQAFIRCESIEKVEIPSKVQFIGEYAFYHCPNLKEIHIKALPSTLKTISPKIVSDYETVTLYIPYGTYNEYWLTELGNFTNIVEE